MPVTPLSFEGRIESQLRELDCSANGLADISGVVSKSKLARALSGERALDHNEAVRVLECLREMQELKALSQTPPNWKEIDQIRVALEERRQFKANLLAEVSRVVREEMEYTTWRLANGINA